jgi:hypothetical protein
MGLRFDVVESLSKLIVEGSREESENVANSIWRLRYHELCPALKTVYDRNIETHQDYVFAYCCLAGMDEKDEILRLLSLDIPWVVDYALSAVNFVGYSEARPKVVELLGHSDPEIRVSAKYALDSIDLGVC